MKISQLRQFKAVADCGKISEASEMLFISSPAVSKSLKKLEEELGVTLFERTGNSLTLNEAGKTLLKDVELLFGVMNKIEKDMQEYSKKVRSLKIGSSLPGGIRFLIPAFAVDRPDITTTTVFMNIEEMFKALTSGKIDIALSPHAISKPEAENIPILEERLNLYAPINSRFAQKQSVALDELENETIILDGKKPNYFSDTLSELANKRNVNINFIYHDDYVVYHQLMRFSQYLFISSNISRKYNEDIPNRVHIPFADKELRITYYISFLGSNKKTVEPFVDWIKKKYKKLLI